MLFYGAIFVAIALRTLNMWVREDGESPAWLEAFRKESLLFRMLMFSSGIVISVLSFQSGAHGHGIGNLFLSVLAFSVGTSFHRPFSWTAQRLGRPLVRWVMTGGLCAWWLFDPDVGIGLGWNLIGSWLLVSAFSSMIAEQWGPDSSRSLPYSRLCFLFDVILLVSAWALGVWPLIVLEIYALVMDVARLVTLRPARAETAA